MKRFSWRSGSGRAARWCDTLSGGVFSPPPSLSPLLPCCFKVHSARWQETSKSNSGRGGGCEGGGRRGLPGRRFHCRGLRRAATAPRSNRREGGGGLRTDRFRLQVPCPKQAGPRADGGSPREGRRGPPFCNQRTLRLREAASLLAFVAGSPTLPAISLALR